LLELAYRYGMYKRIRFVTRYQTDGRLLDLGCATGFFLNSISQILPRSNWELYGVEVNPVAAHLARRQFNLNIFTGTLKEAAYPDEYFNAVTMWDVLEHLHDPLGSLQEIYRILKPEGILVIRVPNLGSRWARWFGRYWAGLEPPRHLYVFDRYTLSQLLSRAGFTIKSASTAISSYLMFVLSVRFWLVGIGSNPVLRKTILDVLYHPISRLISAPIFFIDSLFTRGQALVITARKSLEG
jgi:SAM-dependent methyltransferase